MEKQDFKKVFKSLYNPSSKEPSCIEIPSMQFLMIDGMDARPESKDFQEAITALFSVSYKTKFSIKKSRGTDYAVMPLEGLWWAKDMADFTTGKKENWNWTLMIMQPDFVTQADISNAIAVCNDKAPKSALSKLRLEKFAEGWSGQLLHIGPFATEHANIMRIHDLIKSQGSTLAGKHHEIYLSDFRKTSPEKLKTVLRQPFKA